MEQKVIGLLKTVFENAEITANSSYETIEAWDSMHQLSIAFEIESEFNVSLEPEEIENLKSVSNIIAILKSKNIT